MQSEWQMVQGLSWAVSTDPDRVCGFPLQQTVSVCVCDVQGLQTHHGHEAGQTHWEEMARLAAEREGLDLEKAAGWDKQGGEKRYGSGRDSCLHSRVGVFQTGLTECFCSST